MRTRKLTPAEVRDAIASIPEWDEGPRPRARVGRDTVSVRWWQGDRSVAVMHDGTGTFLEVWDARAVVGLHAIGPRRPLVPTLREALAWMRDGGDLPSTLKGVPP